MPRWISAYMVKGQPSDQGDLSPSHGAPAGSPAGPRSTLNMAVGRPNWIAP